MDAQQRSLQTFIRLCSAFLIIAALYLARELFIPLALAALFAFLLSPLVKLMCRWSLPRVVSVILVTVFTFTTLAVLTWFVGGELHSLANELPSHRQNIREKIVSIKKAGQGGAIEKLRNFAGDMSETALGEAEKMEGTLGDNVKSPPSAQSSQAAPPPKQPQDGSGATQALNKVLSALADGLGTASVVVLFVIFMLLRQQDISQRIVRLVGFSHLTDTTRAIDEVGDRISKYLLMQGTVNGIYGLMLAIGLAIIGLPYVVLWGVLAAMFRFIPYIGPWIVAVLPIGLSLAVFEGWTQPLMVIALIMTLELVTNMILEPVLYGQSAGVSDFALLVAIAFWTWLWGGVGLVLATPMTVCLVVFCKYIPSLGWVDTLLGDKTEPQPHLIFYQQLLAGDEEIAQASAEEMVKKEGFQKTLELIALPALALTRREAVFGKLSDVEEMRIYQNIHATSILLEQVESDVDAKTKLEEQVEDEPKQGVMRIFARALHGEADCQALEMLSTLLPNSVEFDISREPHLIGELVQKLEQNKPGLICVSAMPPRSQLAASVLCRRLRGKLPDLKILVCRWGLPGLKSDSRLLLESGATWVATSLDEAKTIIGRLVD